MKLKLDLIHLGVVVDSRVLEPDSANAEKLLRDEALHDVFTPGRRYFGTWVQVTEVRDEPPAQVAR